MKWLLFVLLLLVPVLLIYGGIWFYCYQNECRTYLSRTLWTLSSYEQDISKTNQFVISFYEKLKYGSIIIPRKDGLTVDIGIAVLNAQRFYPPLEHFPWYKAYLSITLAHILNQTLKSNVKLNIDVLICQFDYDKQTNNYTNQWEKFIPTIKRARYSVLINNTLFEKEREDYVFCMESAYQKWPNSKAILILEDDAVPVASFIELLPKLLHQIENPVRVSPSTNWAIAFVKLHHPGNLRKIPWYFQAGSISFLLPFTILVLLRNYLPRKTSLYLYGSFLFTLLLLSSFTIGGNAIMDIVSLLRSWLGLQDIYLVVPESCCTALVLFPTKCIPQVIKYLNEYHCHDEYAKDHLLDDLPYTIGLKGYMTSRNYVEHIGQFSSLR